MEHLLCVQMEGFSIEGGFVRVQLGVQGLVVAFVLFWLYFWKMYVAMSGPADVWNVWNYRFGDGSSATVMLGVR